MRASVTPVAEGADMILAVAHDPGLTHGRFGGQHPATCIRGICEPQMKASLTQMSIQILCTHTSHHVGMAKNQNPSNVLSVSWLRTQQNLKLGPFAIEFGE